MTTFQKGSNHQPAHWTELEPNVSPRRLALWCPNCRQPIMVTISPEIVTPDATGQTLTVNGTLTCGGACGFSEAGSLITGL